MKTISNQLSLVILAGGMGSRYKGQKQIDPIGPNRESLMEYSIYDAMEVGIKHFVFIVNQNFDNETKKYYQRLIEKREAHVEFILQTPYTSVPRDFFDHIIHRSKPWGTGHALLCAKSHVLNPFIVINADDFYGKSAYKMAMQFMAKEEITANKYGIITYELGKTLSENGSVSRGICKIKNKILRDVVEHTNILRSGETIVFEEDNISGIIDQDTPVSMNFWILHPSIFKVLEHQFEDFMRYNAKDLTKEFFLPQVINELIHDDIVEVIVENSKDQWFGMTYPGDKHIVQDQIIDQINHGFYPKHLWG